MENSKQIIEALGDSAVLAKYLGIPKTTVQSWKTRGIPAKWQLSHPKLWRRGIKLISVKV
jgi:hypothetical protein